MGSRCGFFGFGAIFHVSNETTEIFYMNPENKCVKFVEESGIM